MPRKEREESSGGYSASHLYKLSLVYSQMPLTNLLENHKVNYEYHWWFVPCYCLGGKSGFY